MSKKLFKETYIKLIMKSNTTCVHIFFAIILFTLLGVWLGMVIQKIIYQQGARHPQNTPKNAKPRIYKLKHYFIPKKTLKKGHSSHNKVDYEEYVENPDKLEGIDCPESENFDIEYDNIDLENPKLPKYTDENMLLPNMGPADEPETANIEYISMTNLEIKNRNEYETQKPRETDFYKKETATGDKVSFKETFKNAEMEKIDSILNENSVDF